MIRPQASFILTNCQNHRKKVFEGDVSRHPPSLEKPIIVDFLEHMPIADYE